MLCAVVHIIMKCSNRRTSTGNVQTGATGLTYIAMAVGYCLAIIGTDQTGEVYLNCPG